TGFAFTEDTTANGVRSHIFKLIKDIVYTKRLHLIPLSPVLLQQYILANNIFEIRYGLRINNRKISSDVENRVRTFLLPQLYNQKINEYIYKTFWIAVERDSKLIVGEIGFKGIPDGRGEVEIGYGTMPGYTNKGFMTEM